MSKSAKLRCCASCEWIFTGATDCPMCGFGSYGARWVYGNIAYRFRHTQQPWFDKKIDAYGAKLRSVIKQAGEPGSKRASEL